MADYIVLLRAIGPGNTMPMADLRAMCVDVGLADPETYIASGNLIVGAARTDARKLVRLVEDAIRDRFGLTIDAVARRADGWRSYARGNPFDGDPAALPRLVHLGLSNDPPAPGLFAALEERAVNGERIRLVGDALWIDYGAIGAGKTKLTPAFINKRFGSPVTQRNLNTVNKLLAMVEARG